MRPKNKQTVLFEDLFAKPVHVEFSQPAQSSDGGVILLKAIDERMHLTERLAKVISDERQEPKVRHTIRDMLRERIYGIACGYSDCNDAAIISNDPMIKMACDRDALNGEPLASQPTLARFENAASRTDLLRITYAITDTVIENERKKRRRHKVRRITIDMDPTEDRTHGQQQFTFFSAYYDSWCYLPMVTTIQFNNEAEEFLVAPVPRAGNAPGKLGAISILKRLVPRLRAAFPGAKIYARMDGAFAAPEVFDWLEEQKLKYTVNMAKNSVLEGFAKPLMEKVRQAARESGCTERMYGEAQYKAGKWKKARRAVIKAEVVALQGRELRDNPRFVITNVKRTPKGVYRLYSARGDMENRIKELEEGLDFDRTSCTKFEANQFRNLLTASAYVLYQQLRRYAAGTEFERVQVFWLRGRMIKIGVTVKESVRRIVLKGPLFYPWLREFRQIATACT